MSSLVEMLQAEFDRRIPLVQRFQREFNRRRYAFQETEHPRADDGKFTDGGGGVGQPFYDASNAKVGRLLDGMTTAKMKAVLSDLRNAGKNPEAQRTIASVLERRGVKGSLDNVTDAIRKMEPGADRGALAGIRDIRKQFPWMSKEAFDRMMLQAARDGKVSLHYHDYPASLTQEERDELVFQPDPDAHTSFGGTFYVGAAIRQNT